MHCSRVFSYTCQSGDILTDWRSSIGSNALTIVNDYFRTNNLTSTASIKDFVAYAVKPPFPFIYAEPNGDKACPSLSTVRSTY